jgi:hypothetical protein
MAWLQQRSAFHVREMRHALRYQRWDRTARRACLRVGRHEIRAGEFGKEGYMTTDTQYAEPLPNPYPKLVRLIDASIDEHGSGSPLKAAPEIASKVFDQITQEDRDWFSYLQIVGVVRQRFEQRNREMRAGPRLGCKP